MHKNSILKAKTKHDCSSKHTVRKAFHMRFHRILDVKKAYINSQLQQPTALGSVITQSTKTISFQCGIKRENVLENAEGT